MSGALQPGRPPVNPAPGIPQQPTPMFSNPLFNAQPGVPMRGRSIFNPSGSIAPARYGSVMGNSAQYGRGMTDTMPGNVSVMNGSPQGRPGTRGGDPSTAQGSNPYMGGQAEYGYDDPAPGRLGGQQGAK